MSREEIEVDIKKLERLYAEEGAAIRGLRTFVKSLFKKYSDGRDEIEYDQARWLLRDKLYKEYAK